MGTIEERKALDKLSASYRRLVAGGKVPPPETPPEPPPTPLPASPQPAPAVSQTPQP